MTGNSAILNKTPMKEQSRSSFRGGFLLVLRLVGAFLAMLFAYVISGQLIGVRLNLSAEEASQSGTALLIVALITSLALAYPILRSRWYGVKLMGTVVILLFGVETFMSQIETLYFIGALKMPLDLVLRVIASGFLRALIFAPLAVIVLGKLRGMPLPDEDLRLKLLPAEWVVRFAILSLLYVVVYFAFGYFVAMQWTEAQAYYDGTFVGGLQLVLFQVLRGVMWAALALPIAAMMRGKAWETCLATALVFAIPLASGVIFPNPFMPAMVRQAHFFELTSSMLTYGAIAGWVWTRSSHKSNEQIAAGKSTA